MMSVIIYIIKQEVLSFGHNKMTLLQYKPCNCCSWRQPIMKHDYPQILCLQTQHLSPSQKHSIIFSLSHTSTITIKQCDLHVGKSVCLISLYWGTTCTAKQQYHFHTYVIWKNCCVKELIKQRGICPTYASKYFPALLFFFNGGECPLLKSVQKLNVTTRALTSWMFKY